MEIIEKEIGHVFEIEEQVPVWKMPSVMGKDYEKIVKVIKNENNLEMGIPYARYIGLDWKSIMSKNLIAKFFEMFTKKWHFQVGIPVSGEINLSEKINLSEEIKNSFINKSKYIKAIHCGAYHKVGKTYKEMYLWAIEKKLSLCTESIEFYLNDPGKVKKEELETMILIPII